jgi:antitoxin component YwqK of YwqJK toxin-antitoxin module
MKVEKSDIKRKNFIYINTPKINFGFNFDSKELNVKNILLFFLVLFFSVNYNSQTTDAQGRKQGYWKKKDEKTGKLIYEGEFKDDKPTGKFIYYYPNDTARRAVMFFYHNGEVAYANLYHPTSGRLMAQGKYVNEKKDSIWKYFDEAGKLISTENYINGKKEGKAFVFLNEIEIIEEVVYKNDKKHGPYKQYYQAGKIKCTGHYENGEKQGKFTWYYPNGKIYQVGNYINGQPEGIFLIFEKDGKIKEKQVFFKGTLLKGKDAEAYEKKLKENPVLPLHEKGNTKNEKNPSLKKH